jgi:hypothetical protein
MEISICINSSNALILFVYKGTADNGGNLYSYSILHIHLFLQNLWKYKYSMVHNLNSWEHHHKIKVPS